MQVTNDRRARTADWPEGLRASLPTVIPTAAVAISFGLLAAPALGVPATVAMSMLVWSGTAQFAALSVLSGGGGAVLAAATGLLANARFVPMGFAIAPSVQGGARRRLTTGALLADASFAIGHRGHGRFDIDALRWAAPAQWTAWLSGTVIGALGAGLIGDPDRFGLDVLFPIFYLSLLLPAVRGPQSRRSRVVGLSAAVVTLALIPLAPVGVPVLVAAAAALLGLRR